MTRRRSYRLRIDDEAHLHTLVSRRFTLPLLCAAALGGVALCTALAVAVIVLTPLRNLLPGYLAESQRGATEEGLMRLDSLQEAMNKNAAYLANLASVLDTERTPAGIPSDSVSADTRIGENSDTLLPASERERKFVAAMRRRERFNIPVTSAGPSEAGLRLPATSALLTAASDGKDEAVLIITSEGNLQAPAEGAVVGAWYSPAERGYTITMQHEGGYVTQLLHAGTPTVAAGDKVSAGETVAFTPSRDANGTIYIKMRVWHDGTASAPSRYFTSTASVRSTGAPRYESPRGK